MILILTITVAFLAYANGANDNFKGVDSLCGLPVSTTHISVGALPGVGTVTGQAKWKTVILVPASWVITLPVTTAWAATACQVIHSTRS